MNVRMLIWVTSNCTLSCKWCNQKYTMEQNAGYEMSLEEVSYIVASCKERGIRFHVIELTGGEASLWTHLEAGVQLFKQICDSVTLATNGNNPDRILALNLPTWIVSESQATPAQMEKYHKVRSKLTINSHAHKQPPQEFIPAELCLPAICCTGSDPEGIPQISIEYIRGEVYYCCTAFALTEFTGKYERLVCDFEEDFLQKYAARRFDLDICQYCICNAKIWNLL